MKEAELYILIIAEKTPRAGIIKQFLEENSLQAHVEIVSEADDFRINGYPESLVCIADLVSVQEPSFHVIERIRKKLPRAKIIAMHIYRSAALIQPMFEFGIDGYLYSEPSREELSKAIRSVTRGEKYHPDFLRYT